MDYKPLSRIFQDAGQAIRVGSSRLTCIDISKSRFLAQRDLPPVKPPFQCVPQEIAAPRKETASTHLSLEAEIDQFHFKEEGDVLKRSVDLSDSEVDLDRFSTAQFLRLIVARIDTITKAEEEGMDLK